MIEAVIGWSFIVASFAVLAFVTWCLFVDDDDPPGDDPPGDDPPGDDPPGDDPDDDEPACHRLDSVVSF